MAIRLFNSVKLYNINNSPRQILAFGVPFFRSTIWTPIVKQPRIPKLEIITAIKLSMEMFNAIVLNDVQRLLYDFARNCETCSYPWILMIVGRKMID